MPQKQTSKTAFLQAVPLVLRPQAYGTPLPSPPLLAGPPSLPLFVFPLHVSPPLCPTERGLLLQKLKDYRKAVKELTKAAEADPKNPQVNPMEHKGWRGRGERGLKIDRTTVGGIGGMEKLFVLTPGE